MADRSPLDWVTASRDAIVSQLRDFVRFPSVGAQPKHNADVAACANWLVDHLRSIGLSNARAVATSRHPIVRADWLNAPGRPTILIYGHYDVQPADPLDEWKSPPFSAAVRGEHLYGRGSTDDKGQMFAYVKAVEAFLRAAGQSPVNIKCLFEGEEESGSTSLPGYLARHGDELAADAVVLSDSPMASMDRPAITYAMRGSLSLSLTVHGPERDLHSGLFGGAILNPIQALSELVAGMHHGGRVSIDGFYNDVRDWSPAERAFMRRHGPSDASIVRQSGVERGWGEPGYSLYERTTIRPALTVNGVTGGYGGPGGKAVIPASASAKLSFRLVPDQDPRRIREQFLQHLECFKPSAVRLAVRTEFMARPVVLERRHPIYRAAVEACVRSFGKSPAFHRCGGTIPVISMLKRRLGAPIVLLGFGRPDARIHSPNERLHLPTFFKSVAACIHFLSGATRVRFAARRERERAP